MEAWDKQIVIFDKKKFPAQESCTFFLYFSPSYETDLFPGCGRFYQKQSGQLFATEISQLPPSLHSIGRQAHCSVLRQEESEACK
jgi:hypothetical protein